jgi:tRNA (mo5U34)-methyltransferase
MIKSAVRKAFNMAGLEVRRKKPPSEPLPLAIAPEGNPPTALQPPAGFNPEKFFEGCQWHQRWEVFQGVFTPGPHSINTLLDNLGLPYDLTGKSVLDVGAYNGCVALECERRGAAEVVALDCQSPETTGFDSLRQILGSKAKFVRGSAYQLDPDELGQFDVVIFSGVLYHLRYPMLAIDNLRRISKGCVYVETYLSTGDLSSPPLWEFYKLDELQGDFTNWFGPTPKAVIEAFDSAGFDTRVVNIVGSRGLFQATVREGPPEFLAIPSLENVFYDLQLSHLLGPRRF